MTSFIGEATKRLLPFTQITHTDIIVQNVNMNTMNEIENLDDRTLLNHFKDAVCDNNYNPSSSDYNQSGFTYDELRSEILKRMSKCKHEYDE